MTKQTCNVSVNTAMTALSRWKRNGMGRMIDKDTVKRSLARSDGQECIDKLIDITLKLLAGGILSMSDIIKQNGWCKSVNYNGSVFFIYAGKMTRANKIYYNAINDQLTDTNGKLIELHT